MKQGVPYKFEIVSKDVVHDFNVPDFTILMDAVPGRVNVVWNLFDKPGEFHIQCREYCGFGHATMKAKLFVEPQTVEAAEKPTGNFNTSSKCNFNTSSKCNFNTSSKCNFNRKCNFNTSSKCNFNTETKCNFNTSSNATSTQAPNATSTQAPATAGSPGTPLTILEGSSVQGSPSYDPATLTVKKGDKITVTNKDTLPHTVTSGTGPTDPNSAKQFDTSILEPGATADIETTNINPAEYPFHCTVHPYMMGKLVQ